MPGWCLPHHIPLPQPVPDSAHASLDLERGHRAALSKLHQFVPFLWLMTCSEDRCPETHSDTGVPEGDPAYATGENLACAPLFFLQMT